MMLLTAVLFKMRSSLSYLNGFGDLESIFGMVTVRGAVKQWVSKESTDNCQRI